MHLNFLENNVLLEQNILSRLIGLICSHTIPKKKG